jgi:hypothetical protein
MTPETKVLPKTKTATSRVAVGQLRQFPLLLSVRLGVMFRGFFGVMRRLQMMAVRRVRVMCGLLVVAGLVVLGGLAMVVGRIVMVLGGLGVMMRCILRHGKFPFAGTLTYSN